MDAAPVKLYTIKLNPEQIQKLGDWLDFHQWERYNVAYAEYAYRGHDVNVVAYKSGKVVIQGKKTEEFVKFTLEPEITQTIQMGYEAQQHPEWIQRHGGMDESGKGDLFGPLVSACVVAGGDTIQHWIDKGIKDSKLLRSDRQILAAEAVIRESKDVVIETFSLSMWKYNELYGRFGANMNRLLAWYHAKCLSNVLARSEVSYVVLDQFTKHPLVQEYFRKQPVTIEMFPRAEADPVVAAASIIARAEYIRQMEKLSELAGEKLLKGASEAVLEQAKSIVKRLGSNRLNDFAKMHFSTAQQALWS